MKRKWRTLLRKQKKHTQQQQHPDAEAEVHILEMIMEWYQMKL